MPRSRTDRILLGLLAVSAVAFVWVIRDSFAQRVVKEGDKAPHFRVTTDQGKTVTPTDFGGRVLVLNFWATWCPPCIAETPSLSQFAATSEKDGVVVLAVSVDKNQQAYEAFLQQAKPAFQTVRDSAADIPTDFGTFKWPETYVIDRDGRVRRKYIANRDWMDPAIINEIKSYL